MSTFGTGLTEGGNLTAAADLSTKQFCAVKVTGVRQVNVASSGGEAIFGILQNRPKSGDPAEVTYDGLTKALAGTGGWTAGQALMTDTNAALVAQTSTSAKVAVAIETVSAGEVGLVRVIPTPG